MGFMKNYRRLNVALTRAKFGLYIFGDCDLLNKHEEWKSLIKVLDKRGSIIKDKDFQDLLDNIFETDDLLSEDSRDEENDIEAGVDFYGGQEKMDWASIQVLKEMSEEDKKKEEKQKLKESQQKKKVKKVNRLKELLKPKNK